MDSRTLPVTTVPEAANSHKMTWYDISLQNWTQPWTYHYHNAILGLNNTIY